MGNSDINEPKQQRSIEKKKLIVEAGFRLFCLQGYYNTNTAEIAKEAGVATGSVYRYFPDKKAIFLSVLEYYSNLIVQPILELVNNLSMPVDLSVDLPVILEQIIDATILTHTMVPSAHEEMLAMSHLDEDVNRYFCKLEDDMIKTLVGFMSAYGIRPNNPYEKIHLALTLVENLCHEIVYHRHNDLDYTVMRKEAVDLITVLLNS